MCSLLAEVEDGRVVRVSGDPEQPYTAGFACAKVNRDAELVHSPKRIATPLRRIGVDAVEEADVDRHERDLMVLHDE